MNLRSLWFKIKGLKCRLFGHDFLYLEDYVADAAPEDLGSVVFNMYIYTDKECKSFCLCCGKQINYKYHCLGLNPPTYIKTDMKKVDITNDFGYIEDIYRATPEDLALAKMLNEDHYKILKTLNPNVKEM